MTSVICTYGERHHMQWLYDEEKKPETGITYNYLPTPERVFNKEYVPTDVPDKRLTAHKVPSGTPPEAYRLHP